MPPPPPGPPVPNYELLLSVQGRQKGKELEGETPVIDCLFLLLLSFVPNIHTYICKKFRKECTSKLEVPPWYL